MSVPIRTSEQIEKMRIAGRLAARVLEMIEPHVVAGVTTAELDRICHVYMTEELDAQTACLGYRGFPKSICTSINHVVCHGIPSEKKTLKSGDIINIDITVIKDGWYGDTSKMFLVGNVPEHAQRLCRITQECLYKAIDIVRPGTRLGDIGHIIQAHAEANHYSVVRDYCGHGIGDEFHQEPQVLHYGKPDTGLELREGMTFTIEPMINAGRYHTKLKSDGWTVETRDGRLSAQWEHTLVVTATGVEVLTARSEETFLMAERFENVSLIFFDSRRFLSDLEHGNPIQIFRDALNAANMHFNTRFLEGGDVRTLVNERATFMDRILFYAWNHFSWDQDIALLAVGGYGRHELHPHSDVDLMLLHRRGSVKRYQDSIEQFLTFLWDIQLKIGHSVRSLSQCVAEAKADITVVTNLMESRTIVGDESLRRAMQEKTAPTKLWRSAKFFAAKRQEQQERHRRHGFTEYNLEPNVKEAPGGLRDIQTISWVAHRHLRTTSPKDLVLSGFLTEEEYSLLLQGENFLWKVRYGLHLLAGRPEERLLFDYQRQLAQLFGFRDTTERLGVELFMQRYYRVVLMMRELNDVLLQYLDEVILRGDRAREVRLINERFQARDHCIETRHENVFHDQPSAMLELFALMGESEHLKGIRATTIRQLRQHRHLIDDDFRADPVNRELFMRLLRSSHKMSHQLTRMHRYGILGAYLPEFGDIVGQMQHDLFHIYPVDAHTLQLITNLRRFGNPKYAEQFPIAAHIYQNLTKPELLHIAGLYHDIAKGRGGDHSLLGADEVEHFAQRHGLGKQESRLLRWLVENHLLMSSTSQREDISDPDVILKFAIIVGDRLHLDCLYLLTVADINATNPTLWTSWKASLLSQLYFETRRALMRGLENPVDRQDWVNASRREALERLEAEGISQKTATTVWEGVEDDFFLQEKAEDIAAYTKAVVDLPADEQSVILIKDTGQETPIATQIFVHTRDKANTFAITAVTLDRLRLDIQDARLHSTVTGGSFNTFYVLDERARPFGRDRATLEKVRQALTDALCDAQQGLAPVAVNIQRSTSRQLRHFSMRTVATIRNDLNADVTILEVVTPDRPGLLAHLGNIFMRFNLRLHSAKVSTLGERVEDVFYLTTADDKPLGSQELCESLRQAICEELDARNRQEAAGGELRKTPLW